MAFGPVWQNLDAADVLNEGLNASIGFTSNNQLKTAGQFWLELPGLAEAKFVLAEHSVKKCISCRRKT